MATDDGAVGPRQDRERVAAALAKSPLWSSKVSDPEEEVAERLCRGEVVGWYSSGRCEAGPRALGGRSMLANPQRAQLRA